MLDYIISKSDSLNARNLFNGALQEATFSDNCEQVKLGLGILELFDTDQDEKLRTVIRNLALYDEFTLYALFCMRKWKNAESEMLDIGRKTHGFNASNGTVHAATTLFA